MDSHSLSSLGDFPDTLQQLPGIRLGAAGAPQAFVAAQGAQVLSWQTADGIERLYLSPTTGGLTRDGRKAAPIRGGVPVCFPQFSDRGTMVKHGFARNFPWRPDARSQASLALMLHADDASRQHWQHDFELRLEVNMEADALEIVLKVANTGKEPFSFMTALHTYLRVDDVRRIRLVGLHRADYQDATDKCTVKRQDREDLTIPGEVDRVYMNTAGTVQMFDADVPALTLSQRGFADTVVWNPGPERARMLADMPDDDWLHMLCVEAACAISPVNLAPGEQWEGSQRLSTR